MKNILWHLMPIVGVIVLGLVIIVLPIYLVTKSEAGTSKYNYAAEVYRNYPELRHNIDELKNDDGYISNGDIDWIEYYVRGADFDRAKNSLP